MKCLILIVHVREKNEKNRENFHRMVLCNASNNPFLPLNLRRPILLINNAKFGSYKMLKIISFSFCKLSQ